MKKNYNEMKIRNLRYNVAIFAMTTTISITSIATVIYAFSPIDKNKTPQIMAIEINEMPTNIEKIVINEYQQVEAIVKRKDYSGMNLSNEFEDEIKRLAKLYGIPYEIVLTIGERESAGMWNNNGIISSTNDYGEFQINECNLSYIEENLGFTKTEILNNPVKNAEACIFLLKNIMNRGDVNTVAEVFGMYNGWVGWEKKPLAVIYSDSCCEIINDYFPDYEYEKGQKSSGL